MSDIVVQGIPVYDLEDEDFFTKFQLQPDSVLDNGVCGDIFLAIPIQRPDLRRVVKTFTLLDEENRSSNQQSFHTEVKFMNSFDHPFLMKCLIAGQSPEYLAICMHYYQRGTLDNYVGNLESDIVELCITQVSCALRYMHAKNVVHLDVKLDNIFVDSDFNAILGDFGLAEQLSPQKKTLARRRCGGTTGYLAPEMIASTAEKELDPYKLDSYSLGVVLWALVMEKDPDENINYYRTVRKERDLERNNRYWLLKLLERNPSKRPTITEMLNKVRLQSDHKTVIDMN